MREFTTPLAKVVKEFSLEPLYYTEAHQKEGVIRKSDVSRPGLNLCGYFDFFEPDRIQIFGNSEIGYLGELDAEHQSASMEDFFSHHPVAAVITRNLSVPETFLSAAQKYEVPVFRTGQHTSEFVASLISFLNVELAPRITRHGVLVEVYGEGVLLTGESGIGKSETAVELLKRGHRLIADDAVEIKKVSGSSLIGTAPELIRDYIELRGIGIVNVAKLFGMGAVKVENEINLVVNIVPWNTHEVYDRLGLEDQYTEILGVKIPMNTIPVTPGRNLAVILEVAAMNNRQRKFGYNPALEFIEQTNRHFERSMGNR